MRKVIGIGETVLDIIFKNGKPTEAVPGGSTFNAIVSLGRAGVPCTFFSEAGNDRVGEYIINFLRDNGVNASTKHQQIHNYTTNINIIRDIYKFYITKA